MAEDRLPADLGVCVCNSEGYPRSANKTPETLLTEPARTLAESGNDRDGGGGRN